VIDFTLLEWLMLSRFAADGCAFRMGSGWIARSLAAACLVVSLDTTAVGLGGGALPLYDASSDLLPTHASWGWTYGATGTPSVTQVTGGVLTLDSTASSGQAGYNLYGGANLNSTLGFALDFSFKLNSETHGSNANRSGFSIIVLDQAAQGVELSFWTNEVWAKNADPAFSHSATESISVDTTIDRTYRLTFLGGTYTLTTDGAAPLSGALRHYHYSSGIPMIDDAVNAAVYDQTHYIFFGDNTMSAAANVALSAVTLAPVPEPAEWALMLLGLACVVAAARRRRVACAV